MKPLTTRWVTLALIALLAPASPASEDGDSPLTLTRTDIDVRLEIGNQTSRKLRLENHGDTAIRIQSITATNPAVQLSLGREGQAQPIPEDLDLEIKAGGGTRLQVVIDSSGLDFGPHEFHVRVVPEGGVAPLEMPIKVEVREKEREDDDEKPGWHIKPIKTEGAQPNLEFDRYVHDFGEVWSGERLSTEFRFKNTGEGDLLLQSIQKQCSCSIARLVLPGGEVSRAQLREKIIGVLKPGEEALLEVELDTAKLGGDVRKQFTVITNDQARHRSELIVGAEVSPAMRVNPPSANFGEVRASDGASMSMKVTSQWLENYILEGFEIPVPPVVDVSLRKLKRKEETHEITVSVRPDAPFGRHVGTVKIAVDHPRVKEFRIVYDVTVQPDVIYAAEKGGGLKVDFNIVKPPHNTERRFQIVNHNPAVPYHPKSIRVESRVAGEAIETELITHEEGVRYELVLRVVEAPKLSFFTGKVLVEAPDYPALTVQELNFAGSYQGKR